MLLTLQTHNPAISDGRRLIFSNFPRPEEFNGRTQARGLRQQRRPGHVVYLLDQPQTIVRRAARWRLGAPIADPVPNVLRKIDSLVPHGLVCAAHESDAALKVEHGAELAHTIALFESASRIAANQLN